MNVKWKRKQEAEWRDEKERDDDIFWNVCMAKLACAKGKHDCGKSTRSRTVFIRIDLCFLSVCEL